MHYQLYTLVLHIIYVFRIVYVFIVFVIVILRIYVWVYRKLNMQKAIII